MLAKPIPEGVQANDPIWQSQYIELVNALVLEGAKAKIILVTNDSQPTLRAGTASVA
jgi:hypothetical protein